MDMMSCFVRSLRQPAWLLVLLLAAGTVQAQITRDGRWCEDPRAAMQAEQRAGFTDDRPRVDFESPWVRQQMQAPVDADPENIRKAIARFQVMGRWNQPLKKNGQPDNNALQPHVVASYLKAYAKDLQRSAAMGYPMARRTTVAEVVATQKDDAAALSAHYPRLRDAHVSVHFADGSDPLAAFKGGSPYALSVEVKAVPGFTWNAQRFHFNRICAVPKAGQPVPPSFRTGTCIPLSCDADLAPLNEALQRQASEGGTVRQTLTCAPDHRTYPYPPLAPWQLQQVEALRAGALQLSAPEFDFSETWVGTCPPVPPYAEAAAELAALPCDVTATCQRDKLAQFWRNTDHGRALLQPEALVMGIGVFADYWLLAAGLLAAALWLLAWPVMRNAYAHPSSGRAIWIALATVSMLIATNVLPYILGLAMLFAYSASTSSLKAGSDAVMGLAYVGIGICTWIGLSGIVEGARIIRGHAKWAFMMFWAGLFLLGPLLLAIAVLLNTQGH